MIKKAVSFGLAVVALTGCAACGKNDFLAYDSFAYFGSQTRWAFSSASQETDRAVWETLKSNAEELQNSVSLSCPESCISRFNAAPAGALVELDATAYQILKTAQEMYALTDGAYNPAMGIYIDLWGFSPRFRRADYAPVMPYDRQNFMSELPDPRYLRAFFPLTDFSKVRIWEDGGYFAQKPDCTVTVDGAEYTMQLDFGGIAKGACTDIEGAKIREAGYRNGYFHLGTSSMYVLENPSGGVWEIGVNSPRGELGAQILTLRVQNKTVSSGGDYELYYEAGGTRYCHVIDPQTGYPVNALAGEGILCATVIGGSGALGDALTTAIMAMGRDRAIDFLRQKCQNVGALFVFRGRDGQYVMYTNLDAEEYTLLSDKITAVKV